jgi:hypothetical protein
MLLHLLCDSQCAAETFPVSICRSKKRDILLGPIDAGQYGKISAGQQLLVVAESELLEAGCDFSFDRGSPATIVFRA